MSFTAVSSMTNARNVVQKTPWHVEWEEVTERICRWPAKATGRESVMPVQQNFKECKG